MKARDGSALLVRSSSIFLFICMVSLTALAQDISAAKRKAIVTVMDATNMRGRTAKLFEQQVSKYGASWPESVMADLKAKGVLKGVSPADVAKLEIVLHEFSEKVFSEIKIRVVSQFMTSETFEAPLIAIYDRHFSEEELESLAAFSRNAHSAAVIDKFLAAFDDAYISALEAKGYTNFLGSREAEMKKMESMQKEFASGAQEIVISAARKARAVLTPDELREAQVFVASPVGLKLAKMWPNFLGDVYITFSQLHGSQIVQLSQEVIKKHQTELERQAAEILAKYSVGQQRKGTN